MYLKFVLISNLKYFKRPSIQFTQLAGFSQFIVLAGRNGTGKTSLLKAIAMTILGAGQAIKLGQSSGEWIRYGSSEADVTIGLQADPEDQFRGPGKTTASFPVALSIKKIEDSHQEKITPLFYESKTLSRRSAERGPWANAPLGWFLCGYGPFRHLGPLGTEQLRLNRDPQLARVLNLFHEGATLVESVEWLQYLHLRALEGHASEKILKEEVIKLLNNGLLPDNSTVQRVDSDGLWIHRDGNLQLLDSVSDGYRTVAALVLDIVRHLYGCYGDQVRFELENGNYVCKLPGVVLIDEIDAHMHVSWQQKIGFWLCAHFPRLQFIVTTHSPFICQAASPGALVRLPSPGENRSVEVVPDEVYKAVTQGGIDEAVISELFGLDHPHSDQAEANRARLAALEARILNGKKLTKAEKSELEALRSLLPNTLNDLADQKFRAVMHEEIDPPPPQPKSIKHASKKNPKGHR